MITLPRLPEIHIGKLSNGMKYVFVPDKGSGLIHAEVLGYAGSILETNPNTYGVAHFLEHVVCNGTKSFPNEDVLTNEFDLIGASRNGSTSFTTKKYHVQTDVSKSREAIKFISECILYPIFDDTVIERERLVIQSELKDCLSRASEREHMNSRKISFDFPRLHTHVLGTHDSIGSIMRNDLVDFHERFYSPSNFIFGVVGDIEHSEIVSILEDEIGLAPGGSSQSKIWVEHKKNGRFISTDNGIENSSIEISWSLTQEQIVHDYYKILNPISVLGSMRRSRLYRSLREELTSVYGVRMSMSGYSSFSSSCSIDTSTKKDSVDMVIDASLECVRSFLNDGPTENEIMQSVNQTAFWIKKEMVNKMVVLKNTMGDVFFNPNFVSVENEISKGLLFNKNEAMEASRLCLNSDPLIIIRNPS